MIQLTRGTGQLHIEACKYSAIIVQPLSVVFILLTSLLVFRSYDFFQTDLKENLKENKELAHQYRVKQQEHLKLKEEFLESLEGRISLEASLKDHKQVRNVYIEIDTG